jgi:hypothetical protein
MVFPLVDLYLLDVYALELLDGNKIVWGQTAQLRVDNAAIVRKANLATQLAKKFEEEKKQLQVKLQKLKRVLDKVGGSKLLKQLADILDTEDFSSSRQMSVAHMVCKTSPTFRTQSLHLFLKILSESLKKHCTFGDYSSFPCSANQPMIVWNYSFLILQIILGYTCGCCLNLL